MWTVVSPCVTSAYCRSDTDEHVCSIKCVRGGEGDGFVIVRTSVLHIIYIYIYILYLDPGHHKELPGYNCARSNVISVLDVCFSVKVKILAGRFVGIKLNGHPLDPLSSVVLPLSFFFSLASDSICLGGCLSHSSFLWRVVFSKEIKDDFLCRDFFFQKKKKTGSFITSSFNQCD